MATEGLGPVVDADGRVLEPLVLVTPLQRSRGCGCPVRVPGG